MSRDASELAGATQTTAGSAVWRRAGPAAGLAIAALLLIYWPTTVFTVRYWDNDGAYGHGYLVPLISLYLVWQCRRQLASLTPHTQMWGLPLLFVLGIGWALADVVDVQIAKQLALLMAFGAMIWTLFGTEVSRRLLFPVAYLLIAIPIWSLLTTALQENTAIASTQALRLFGVPVYLEAFYIAIPSGQFVVEEVCSGLRYFLATLSISTLFAYLNFSRISLGAVFVVMAVAVSIIMNWARVVIIILVGHVTSMEHFLVRDHVAFGWVMFVIALVPIFALGIWLQRFDRNPLDGASGSERTAARAPESGRKFFTTAAIALVAVAIGPAALMSGSKAAPMAVIHLQPPLAASPWQIAEPESMNWGPKFVDPDGEVRAAYLDGGSRVSLYIAYYSGQGHGAELVNGLNAFYDQKHWQPRRRSDRRVALEDGRTIGIREIELVTGTGQERLLWYWYQIGDQDTSSPAMAKLWQLWNGITGSPGGAAIALSARDQDSLATARAELDRFLVKMERSISTEIERATAP